MIKKYITLAALLTAGTALANAAWQETGKSVTITTEFTNTSGASSIDGVTPKVSISGVGGSASVTGKNSNHTLWGDGEAAQKYNSIVPKFNVTTDGAWTVSFDYNLSQIVTQTMMDGIAATGQPYAIRLDSVQLHLGAIQNGNGAFVSTFMPSNVYDLTVGLTANGSSSKTRKDISIKGGAPNTLANGNGPDATPIEFIFKPTAQLDPTITLSNATNFQFTVKQALVSTPGSIGLQKIVFNTSVVQQVSDTPVTPPSDPNLPEPSAFGLLAGLGALALVSARRRRK